MQTRVGCCPRLRGVGLGIMAQCYSEFVDFSGSYASALTCCMIHLESMPLV